MGKRPRSRRARHPAAPSGPARPTIAPRTDPPRGSNLGGRRRGCTSNVPREGRPRPQARRFSLPPFTNRLAVGGSREFARFEDTLPFSDRQAAAPDQPIYAGDGDVGGDQQIEA
jgi:hypothetical protein